MSFKALLFDLDGTLQDSEEQTDQAIEIVMRRHGAPGVKLPPFETRGRSWRDVAHTLIAMHPTCKLSALQLEDELLEDWRVRYATILAGLLLICSTMPGSGLRYASLRSSLSADTARSRPAPHSWLACGASRGVEALQDRHRVEQPRPGHQSFRREV